jgi:hypothetical protein
MAEEVRYEKDGKGISVELEYLPQEWRTGWTIMLTANDHAAVVCLPIPLEAAELLFKDLQQLVGKERATIDYDGEDDSALVIRLEYSADSGWNIHFTAHASKRDPSPRRRVSFRLSPETAEGLARQALSLVDVGYEERRKGATDISPPTQASGVKRKQPNKSRKAS